MHSALAENRSEGRFLYCRQPPISSLPSIRVHEASEALGVAGSNRSTLLGLASEKEHP
jgi:hypothetical protein